MVTLRLWHRSPPPLADRIRVREAERELERVRNNWPRVIQVAATATAHHQRNGIAETLHVIFRGDDT